MLWKYFYQKQWMDITSLGIDLVQIQSQVTPSILIKDQQNPLTNEIDVYVTCIGGTIPCHRSILISSSQKFQEILKHEDPTELAEVQMNYTISEMAPVIHFFYNGNVIVMSKEEHNIRKILRELACQFGDISSVRLHQSAGSFQTIASTSPHNHLYRNHLIRYKKLKNGESFNLTDVKILHPQFLH